MWQLVITGPGYLAMRYDLPADGHVKVGRADDSDIVLTGDGVSRRHAEFTRNGASVTLVDLGSRNGTVVNGQSIVKEARLLAGGDEVHIGEYVLRLEELLAQDAPTELAAEERFITLETHDVASNPLVAQLEAPQGGARPTVPGDRIEAPTAPADAGQLLLLFKVAERLAGAPDLASFAGEVLDLVLWQARFDSGAILVRTPRGWDQVAARGAAAGGKLVSQSILRAAIDKRAALVADYLPSDSRYNMRESVVRTGAIHALCVPMLKGSEAVGALYLSTKKDERPSQATIDLVTAVAHLVAVGVERGRLLDRAREEEKLRRALERFHAPDIVDRLTAAVLNGGADAGLTAGMEERVVTMLFADLSGFTPLTERLEAKRVVSLLGEFYTRMTDVIHRWRGTVDKFIGDAVMAIFGAPIMYGDDAVRAVRAALQMRQEFGQIVARRPPEERCGLTIGINTGRVLVGTVGSAQRLEFTAIGDPVNTAARLQGTALAGQIVISQQTRDALGDRFVLQPLGERALKGKREAVSVYAVMEEDVEIQTLPGSMKPAARK